MDEGQILDGYLDGAHGHPAPPQATRSYLYGWQTGMVERGALEPSAEMRAIDRAFAQARSTQARSTTP